MSRDPRTVQALTAALEREIALYKKYLAALEEERMNVTRFNPETIEQLSTKRDGLTEDLAIAREKREELVMKLAASETPLKLSDVVEQHCDREEKRRLMPLVQNLRLMVEKARGASQEFSQVINFSLSMVSSTLSLVWSATEEVQNSYTVQGVTKRSYHPAGAHGGGILTRA